MTNEGEKLDPEDCWDPITATTDGGMIWQNYGRKRRVVVTYGKEKPGDMARAEDERKRYRAQDDDQDVR